MGFFGLFTLIYELFYGAADFGILASAGYGPSDIKRILSDVNVWGFQVNSEFFMFTVSPENAEYAHYKLLQAGIPIHITPVVE